MLFGILLVLARIAWRMPPTLGDLLENNLSEDEVQNIKERQSLVFVLNTVKVDIEDTPLEVEIEDQPVRVLIEK